MGALLALSAALAVAPASSTAADAEVGTSPSSSAAGAITDRVIVQWLSSADHGDKTAARDAADVDFEAQLGAPSFQLVAVEPGQSAAAAIRELEADPAVAVAEPDGYRTLDAVPDDPLFSQLWGLRNQGTGVNGFAGAIPGADVNAVAAWDRSVGTPTTVVADIDSGYRFDSPDLGPVAWTNPGETPGNGIDDDGNGYVDDRNGYDFVDNDYDPGDPLGHGTMVAGVLGARGNNRRGISGVAQRAQIMALRVLDGRGVGTVYTIARAIRYAAAMGARIANVSLSPTTNPGDLNEAIEFARTRGMIVVVIAGNDGLDLGVSPLYPACSPSVNVVTVGATDMKGRLLPWSNRGACVDVAAPGVRIIGTARGGGYGRNTGTSFAAPQVAGAAVLALARRPDLTVEQLAALFRARARARQATTGPIARLDVGAIVTGVALSSS